MDYCEIKKAIKNKEIQMNKVIDILLLNDESVITIWSSSNNNGDRYFATLTNHSNSSSYILELYKKRNINRFKHYIPNSTYFAAKSFTERWL